MSRLFGVRGFVAGVLVASVVGVGGLAVVRATSGSSSASSFVPVTPVRVVDTRSDLGLVSLVAGVEQSVTIVGSLVPLGATAVSLTVTAVDAGAAGFVSVRAGDATGVPSTSNLNVERGGTIANLVVVKLPTVGDHTGKIKVLFDAMGATTASTDVLIDVVGYYELASTGAGATGPAGAKGDTGATGPAGAKGDTGASGSGAITEQLVCDGTDADVIADELCKIGMTGPGGGHIFFVDYNDQYAGFDYLEAAPPSCEVSRAWSSSDNDVVAARGWAARAVGQGQANTTAILAVFTSDTQANNAAKYADSLTCGTKSDWFLGSIGEMTLMYTNLQQAGVGGFSSANYWSSSETGASNAWGQFFGNDSLNNLSKDQTYYVRPVREF